MTFSFFLLGSWIIRLDTLISIFPRKRYVSFQDSPRQIGLDFDLMNHDDSDNDRLLSRILVSSRYERKKEDFGVVDEFINTCTWQLVAG